MVTRVLFYHAGRILVRDPAAGSPSGLRIGGSADGRRDRVHDQLQRPQHRQRLPVRVPLRPLRQRISHRVRHLRAERGDQRPGRGRQDARRHLLPGGQRGPEGQVGRLGEGQRQGLPEGLGGDPSQVRQCPAAAPGCAARSAGTRRRASASSARRTSASRWPPRRRTSPSRRCGRTPRWRRRTSTSQRPTGARASRPPAPRAAHPRLPTPGSAPTAGRPQGGEALHTVRGQAGTRREVLLGLRLGSRLNANTLSITSCLRDFRTWGGRFLRLSSSRRLSLHRSRGRTGPVKGSRPRPPGRGLEEGETP